MEVHDATQGVVSLILIIVFHAGGGICHKLVGKVLTKATGI